MFRKSSFFGSQVGQAALASTIAMVVFVVMSTQMQAAPASAAQVAIAQSVEVA